MGEIIYGNEDRSSVIVLQERVTISGATTSGQIAAFELSSGTVVHRAWIQVETASSGSCTLDVGIGATATTSGDTLLDGISVASTGIKDSADGTDNGTNGVAKPQHAAAGSYVTATVASGDADGFVGTLHILVSGDL